MGKKKQVVFDNKDIEVVKEDTNNGDISIELYKREDNDDKIDNSNLIFLETKQCTPIKTLIETLNGILLNAHFSFTKHKIMLKANNSSETLIVNMELDTENFEDYFCQTEKYDISFKLNHFNRITNSISTNNTLSLFVDKDDVNHLKVKVEVIDKNLTHLYKLNLLDTKICNDINIIDVELYPVVISITSSYLQKICRDAGRYTSNFEIIRSTDERLIFKTDVDNISQETNMGPNNDTLVFIKNKNPNDIIQGKYSLKDIISFSKCSSNSNKAFLYMSNEYPLMIEYFVGNLGKIQLFIARI